jgi:hypothetical protein
VLLNLLPTTWELVGVDPSDVAKRAGSSKFELLNVPFTSALATSLANAGHFDLVTASNCLAHISDLHDVFLGIAQVLSPQGEFVIEVHDLDVTLATAQWDTIYHEHKVEWSIRSLIRCLERIGLTCASFDRLPLHGGLLRATFRKGAGLSAPEPAAESDDPFARLRRSYEERRDTSTFKRLMSLAASGKKVCAYGASGRANVWLNQLPDLPVEFVLDGSPARAGRWIPNRAIPILSPVALDSRPSDACVITAWNYASDIKKKHQEYTGEWLQSFTD